MTTPEQKRKNAERAKKWRAANPDYMKNYMKDYFKGREEEKKAMDRAYHAANREKQNAYRKKWREANPTAQRDWCRANPDKVKNRELKKKYGITLEQYNKLLQDQGGVCKICGQPEKVEGRMLAVDHDHVTGEFRGLLCTVHNTMLGLAQDSKEILLKSINYLDFYQKNSNVNSYENQPTKATDKIT